MSSSTLDPSSFVGQVATHEEPTAVLDVVTTELQVNDALTRNGIHSLLGVRLAPRHKLLGVLYIGLSDTRAFLPSELGRIVYRNGNQIVRTDLLRRKIQGEAVCADFRHDSRARLRKCNRRKSEQQ